MWQTVKRCLRAEAQGYCYFGLSEEPTNFALASSIPFARNGKVIGDLGDNLQYLFLRCDLDEVRIWVNSQGKSYVRSTEDHLRDIYEGVGRLH